MKKFLIILSFLLLPFSAMAANTNVFDRVLVNSNFTSTGLVRILAAQTNLAGFVVTNAIDSPMRNLFSQSGVSTLRWGDLQLDMLDASSVNSIQWGQRHLFDSLGNVTLSYSLRVVRDINGNIGFNWGSRRMFDSSGNDVWNWSNQVFAVSQTFNSNIVVIGSLSVTNTGSFSNVVVQTIDGVSYFNSGTNNLMRIIVNSSAGTLQTEGMFTQATNTLNAAVTPTVNTIYTNNAVRLMVTTGVNLPTGIATVSAVALWSVSGTMTNFTSPVSSSAGVNGAVTNFTMGLVQPSALYMITNINVGAGAPTIIVPTYRETRF